MAYVGTSNWRGSLRETLASVIQGEAGGEGLRGMQAVGGVIANRATMGWNGGDLGAVATAPNQFQGQTPVGGYISPNAYSVADSMIAGTNPDPTGGALYYANPGASSASWARNLNPSNSLVIGNHDFTDNTKGIPFYGNGTTQNTDNIASNGSTDNDNYLWGGVYGSAGNPYTGMPAPNKYDADTTGFQSPTIDNSPSAAAASGYKRPDGSDAGGYAVNGPGTLSFVSNPGNAATTGDQSSLTGSGQQGDWNKYGVISVAQGFAGLGNSITNAVTSMGGGVTTWAQAQLDNLKDMTVRAMIFVLGAILLICGLVLLIGRGSGITAKDAIALARAGAA